MKKSKCCPGCQTTYADPAEAFYKHAGNPSGLQTRCKSCMKADSYERYWRKQDGEDNRQREVRTPNNRPTPAHDKPLAMSHKARRMKAKLAAARLLIQRD